MSIVEVIVLGLIQGLTEFIPVSSSGHLVIAQHLFGTAGDHLFLEWINLGTIIALLIFFRVRIADIAESILFKRDYRLALLILTAAIPAGMFGFIFASTLGSNAFFSSIWTVIVSLMVVGLVMVFVEKFPKMSAVKEVDNLSYRRALFVGAIQVLALVPGVSRSGSTIVAGRLAGLNPARAAEFSFLVSIPIMLGVVLKLLTSAGDRGYFMDNAGLLILGNLIALISGLLAVGFLMRYLQNHSLGIFGWYRIALGLLVSVVLLLQ